MRFYGAILSPSSYEAEEEGLQHMTSKALAAGGSPGGPESKYAGLAFPSGGYAIADPLAERWFDGRTSP
jgi:hypothetical protein